MNKSGFLNLLRDLVSSSDWDEQKKTDLLTLLVDDKFSLITPSQADDLNKLIGEAQDKKEAEILLGNDPEEIEGYTQAKAKVYEAFNDADLAFLKAQGLGDDGGVGGSSSQNLLDVYSGLAE